jgi:hypothetical protein
MMDIKICIDAVAVDAELNDTRTGSQIAAALPIQATFNTWGDEIYFAIPVSAELDESAREVVDVGDLGYWPPGKAFCIFFGPTPMSRSGEIRPASAVNIVGKVKGDATQFRQLMRERQVKLEATPPTAMMRGETVETSMVCEPGKTPC